MCWNRTDPCRTRTISFLIGQSLYSPKTRCWLVTRSEDTEQSVEAENFPSIPFFLLAVLVYNNTLHHLTSVKPVCNYLETYRHIALKKKSIVEAEGWKNEYKMSEQTDYPQFTWNNLGMKQRSEKRRENKLLGNKGLSMYVRYKSETKWNEEPKDLQIIKVIITKMLGI